MTIRQLDACTGTLPQATCNPDEGLSRLGVVMIISLPISVSGLRLGTIAMIVARKSPEIRPASPNTRGPFQVFHGCHERGKPGVGRKNMKVSEVLMLMVVRSP
jgi:hypothetical protein